MPDIDRQWYWDRRSNKAYYPVETDGETVELVSVWHHEEVEGALESGALVSADEIDVLEHLDGPDDDSGYSGSFRLPDDVGTGGDGSLGEASTDE